MRARPADDVDDAFELAVMMRAGLGVGMDRHRAGPDLLRAGARQIDGSRPRHAGRLGGVGVELVARDDLDAMLLPVDRSGRRGVRVSRHGVIRGSSEGPRA